MSAIVGGSAVAETVNSLSVILLLTGPMQSWGEYAPHYIRSTNDYPTKSGTVGMIASALGRHRDESVSDLAALNMKVRVDSPGERLVDFHTILDVVNEGEAKMTFRHYLTDAAFVVVLTGGRELVEAIATAVQKPRWIPFLGRKSCPPGLPMFLGTTSKNPVDLLNRLHVYGKENKRKVLIASDTIEFPYEQELRDVPENFASQPVTHHRRRVGHRRITPAGFAGTGYPAHDTLVAQIKGIS